MVYLLLAIVSAAAVYFFVRQRMVTRALKRTNKDLQDITGSLEENRILKKEAPGKELEELLETINNLLKEIRRERVDFERREREFQRQIENISHDLRTPLTSLIGYLKIIDTKSLTREDEENLAIALRKAGALQRLITQFYDFSRLTADDYQLHVETVDISRILRETLVDTYHEFADKNLEVEVSIPEHPVPVLADVNALERVLLNLLQNAGRYAQTKFTVELVEGEEVLIRFCNDVTGLDEQDAEQMFQRFYVKDAARSQGATGLGLTVALCLAEKMGGGLRAELVDEGVLCMELRLKK